jgi:hypothetical protein
MYVCMHVCMCVFVDLLVDFCLRAWTWLSQPANARAARQNQRELNQKHKRQLELPTNQSTNHRMNE